MRMSGRSVQSQLSRAVASNAQLLAKAELYFTAFLSMSDMVSDIVMVVSQSSAARILTALLLTLAFALIGQIL